jgi:membrane protease YdiL (CAAX protease family)
MLVVELMGAFVAKLTGNTVLNIPNELYSFIGFFIAIALVNPVAEEVFFRLLINTIALSIFENIFENKRILFFVSLFTTTIIFAFMHIEINFIPFEIKHINFLQLISVAFQGAFYYWLYIKTKSIYTSILAHCIANSMYCFAYLCMELIL